MSIYCHLACKTCEELIFVKDADTGVHANPHDLGQFLEKHTMHDLTFVWEDDEFEVDGVWQCPGDQWSRFEETPGGEWSHGVFIPIPERFALQKEERFQGYIQGEGKPIIAVAEVGAFVVPIRDIVDVRAKTLGWIHFVRDPDFDEFRTLAAAVMPGRGGVTAAPGVTLPRDMEDD
jgi:hypothetical protein